MCCAATALGHLTAAGTVPWASENAQWFLKAQFDATPFALVFVDRTEEQVWIGRNAAKEICGRAGIPVLVQTSAVRTTSRSRTPPAPSPASSPNRTL